MKTKSVYIWFRRDGTTTAKATIEVPGLGDVEIEQALSDDLRNRIAEEGQAALRVKFGQVVTVNIPIYVKSGEERDGEGEP